MGETLQDRLFFSAAHNWAARPLRSAIELCVCMGVALHAYGRLGSIVGAIQLGVVCGVCTVLVGDAIRHAFVRPAGAELRGPSRGSAYAAAGCVAAVGVVVAGVLAASGGGGGAWWAAASPEASSAPTLLRQYNGAPTRFVHPERYSLLPPAYTPALRTEFLQPAKLPTRLHFPLLRIKTTGAIATAVDITSSLALMTEVLDAGEPLLALFDMRDTGCCPRANEPRIVPPPLGLVWQLLKWAGAHAGAWDAHAQAIAIVIGSNGAAKPLLQLAIKFTKPPQPMLICENEKEALAFLAKHHVARVHKKKHR